MRNAGRWVVFFLVWLLAMGAIGLSGYAIVTGWEAPRTICPQDLPRGIPPQGDSDEIADKLRKSLR